MTVELHSIIQGDASGVLRSMSAGSVNCCVTSPPYWGLRDYGTDDQIGLESSPDEYVRSLVAVFREVRRVLRDDGTLWLNLGDSYAGTGSGDTHTGFNKRYHGVAAVGSKQDMALDGVREHRNNSGLPAKNLVGIPWRVAFALQADGWYLRQDIIWHKPNPMPESVRDRCTKAHEYLFLLTKNGRYHFDHEAIKEPANPKYFGKMPGSRGYRGQKPDTGIKKARMLKTRHKRSVWTVTTKPYKGAHFATFPPDLIEPCVLAGCPEWGVVLDPFAGAGTTGLVSVRNNRFFKGIELNPEYIKLADERIRKDGYK